MKRIRLNSQKRSGGVYLRLGLKGRGQALPLRSERENEKGKSE